MIIEKLRINHPMFKIGVPKIRLQDVFMDMDGGYSWDTVDFYLWFD